MTRAAAHPRQQRQTQQNVFGSGGIGMSAGAGGGAYSFLQEETKQSSGEIPTYFGGTNRTTGYGHNQFAVGGSGEQEEDLSAGLIGNAAGGIVQSQMQYHAGASGQMFDNRRPHTQQIRQ